MSAISRDQGDPQSPHSAPPQPLLFPTKAKAGSPLSCSTAGAEGCSCWTHGQVWWPKDGEDILGWAQPRDQLLHASPVHTSQQSKNPPCAGAMWAAKLPLPHPPPSTTKRDALKDGFGRCHSQGMLCQALHKAEVLLGHPQLPPQPPRPAGLSQLLTEGDGEDTGLVCSSPRASAVFLQHRNHQEQARQQERRLSQRSRGKERISPPSSGFHPPSWLSSTCCRSGTCHKVS